jgi:diacylglycerol kinase family enzyme
VIAAFVNPRSRANRRNPQLARQFAAVLGEAGRVFAPTDLQALDEIAAALAKEPPWALAVFGGDGTLHKVLTALLRAFQGRPLPPVAILPGGTMNVVSASLNLKTDPMSLLQRMVGWWRSGDAPPTLERCCLEAVDGGFDSAGALPRFAFVFGNGLIANFLTEFYAEPGYNPARAVWLVGRLLLSEVRGDGLTARVFQTFGGRILLDGAPPPANLPPLTAVSAATVREVGLGFKLNHRADDDPDKFAVLAIHASPLQLTQDILPVYAGRGIAPARAFSALARTLTLEVDDGDILYTLDGDLYRAPLRLDIRLGPRLRFIRPR